jgi:hypothetical protein
MFGRGPVVTRLAAAALAAGCGLAAVACGGSSSAAGAAAAAAAARARADPLASLSGMKIATQALADLKAAASVTMKGPVSDSGQSMTIDLGLKPGHGCAGSVGLAGKGSVSLIVIGSTVYLNASDSFWKSSLGSKAPALIQILDGRYIKASTANADLGSLADVCKLSQTLPSTALQGVKTVTKGAAAMLNGVRVLSLKGSDGTTMYVTDTAKPQLVQVSAPAGNADGSGKISISVGAPVTLKAPPASKVFDGATIGL